MGRCPVHDVFRASITSFAAVPRLSQVWFQNKRAKEKKSGSFPDRKTVTFNGPASGWVDPWRNMVSNTEKRRATAGSPPPAAKRQSKPDTQRRVAVSLDSAFGIQGSPKWLTSGSDARRANRALSVDYSNAGDAELSDFEDMDELLDFGNLMHESNEEERKQDDVVDGPTTVSETDGAAARADGTTVPSLAAQNIAAMDPTSTLSDPSEMSARPPSKPSLPEVLEWASALSAMPPAAVPPALTPPAAMPAVLPEALPALPASAVPPTVMRTPDSHTQTGTPMDGLSFLGLIYHTLNNGLDAGCGPEQPPLLEATIDTSDAIDTSDKADETELASATTSSPMPSAAGHADPTASSEGKVARSLPSSDAPRHPVSTAAEPCEPCELLLAACAPYKILYVSPAMTAVCGHPRDDCCGKYLDVLSGPLTGNAVRRAVDGVAATATPTVMSAILYTLTGIPFAHALRIEALCNLDGTPQCLQLSLSNIQYLETDSLVAAGSAAAAASLSPISQSWTSQPVAPRGSTSVTEQTEQTSPWQGETTHGWCSYDVPGSKTALAWSSSSRMTENTFTHPPGYGPSPS